MIRRYERPLEKVEAIQLAGQLLVDHGYIQPAYLQSMLEREKAANTFLANGVAIPHGLGQDRDKILKTGIAVLQAPAGVQWNESQTAHFVVAIAAKSQEHIEVLRRLTRILGDAPLLNRLISTSDPEEIITALTEEKPPAQSEGTLRSVDFSQGFEWTVLYPSGLHARPASDWIEALKPFQAELRLRKGPEIADARSLISILQLGLAYGDKVFVSAQGVQAKEALERLQETMNSLIQREEEQSRQQPKKETPVSAKKLLYRTGDWQPQDPVSIVEGVSASPGLVIGTLQKLESFSLDVEDHPLSASDVLKEVARFEKALVEAQRDIEVVAHETATKIGAAEAQIFKAQEGLLQDPSLLQALARKLMEGHALAWSWKQLIQEQALKLEALGQPLLAARAADLRDVGMRVLKILTGVANETSSVSRQFGPQTLLVARELTPSQTASIDPTYVRGFCTSLGGPTSHTAILARTLGLPAMVGAGDSLLLVPEGSVAILDGDQGRLFLNPSENDLKSAKDWIEKRKAEEQEEAESRSLPAQTADGWRIEVAANVNNVRQLPAALAAGAEGVGLMRTEFLFLERKSAPTEEEQFETYASIVEALQGRPVIIRTLDIGGDKQVPYLNLPHEDNPFLGVRGVRLCLRRPDLFYPQLRAMYRVASKVGPLSIMFPMVTTIEEVKELRRISEEVRQSLAAPQVPLGIMVEMPSVAVLAEKFARHVDFFSIGTNDLTQYTLAIDREHPELAPLADSLHPAVLRLIEKTVLGAKAHGKWVGVCGGLAGHPLGALILAGLGVQEISMSASDIARVKAEIRRRTRDEVQSLAQKALDCETLEEVKELEFL